MAETMPSDSPSDEIETPSTSLAEDNTPTQLAPPTPVVFDDADTPGVSALTEDGVAELAALNDASAPAPRRGRRKKETPKAEPAEPAEEDAAPPVRRPGRGKRVAATERAAAEEEAASATAVPPAEAAPTPKRGRRKKDRPAQAQATPEPAPPAVEVAPAEAPTAKRGRRKKTAEATTAETTPPPAEPAVAEPDTQELQAELGEQLQAVVDRVQEAHPDFNPPPFSPGALIDLVRRNLDRFAPRESMALLRRATDALMGGSDLLNADTWKGMWYMLNYTLQYQGDILKRRLRGEYYTDPYGYDPEFYEAVKPFFDFLYQRYWRVTVQGVENVPSEGPALLASNHSGVLPWDGAMIALAIQREHPNPRLVRGLYANWLPSLPFLSMLLPKMGMVLAHPDNGRRLLSEGELVLVFPEGNKGASKLFKDRYRLQRFGRGGFVQLALETGAPVVPVAVVGSEEIYPVLGRADSLGKPFGLPYVPITPLFPWTGLLGAVPLPSKWSITFDTPIPTEEYGAAGAGDNRLVGEINDQLRARIQGLLYEQLKDRKSIFFG